jgi:hypothetical protein
VVAFYGDYMVDFNRKNQKGKSDEKTGKKNRHKKVGTEHDKVAKRPRRYKLSQESLSGESAGLGDQVHGVREGAGEYKPPEGASGEGEDNTRPLDSTRYLETAQGIK